MTYFYRFLKKTLVIIALFVSHAVFSQPVISSFSPAAGPVGTSVTITGSGFNSFVDSNIVFFGAVKAVISAATSTSLTVTVPQGATYQPITVTTNRLTAYSRQPFNVTFAGGGYTFHPGSFAAKIDYSTGSNPRGVAITDLNGDGKPDVFVTNQVTANPSIFKNTSTPGNISLLTQKSSPLGSDPFGVAVGDFNGDGKPDVAVTNDNNGLAGTVSVLRNISTTDSIKFVVRTDSVGMGPIGVAIADIDGDGKPDLLVGAGNAGVISIFRNITTSVDSIMFAPRIDIQSFGHADNIAVADLDGDGKTDLVSANFTGSISIWKNISTAGTIVFASRVDYTAGGNPDDIAIGDINGDGKPDIAVANYSSSTFSLFKNEGSTGTISFTKKDFATGTHPRSISIGDLDGDGKPDVIVPVDTPSAASVFKNISTTDSILFSARADYIVGGSPTGSAIGDLDGDGKPDLAVANSYSLISVFRNKGHQPYISSFSPTIGDSGTVVTIKGVNLNAIYGVSFGNVPASSYTYVSDTVITAVVGTGATGNVTVSTTWGPASLSGFIYRAAPKLISFTPQSGNSGAVVTIRGTNLITTSAVRFGAVPASSFTVASDSVITAIVGSGATGSVSVTTSFGTDSLPGFTFNALPVITSVTPSSGAVGTTVIITGNNFGDSTGNIVYFGAVQGVVTSASKNSLSVIVPAGASYQPVSVTTNGLTAYSAQPFIVTFPGADSSFTPASFAARIDSATSANALKIVKGDVDGDGKPDAIVLTNNIVAIYRNTGSNNNIAFAPAINYTITGIAQSIAIADVNGDGKLDIVTASSNDTVSILRNTSTAGTVSFTPGITFPASSFPYVVAVADIDQDGKPDIAVLTSSRNVSVYKNTGTNGSISFAARTDFFAGNFGPRSMVINDFNGDGKPDVAVTATGSADSVYILRNNATARGIISFAPRISLPASRGVNGIATGDLDKDGRPDIVVANRTAYTISVYKNNSDSSISFATRLDYRTDSIPLNVAIGDLDGDGKPDIAVNNSYNNVISVFKNRSTSGALSFASKVNYATGLLPYDIMIEDMSGDGKPELATVNRASSTISFLRNKVGDSTVHDTLAPVITGFTPDSARTGTRITIFGSHFTGANAVSFGGVAADSIRVLSDTVIFANVGAGASGNVLVTTLHGTGTKSGFKFISDSTGHDTLAPVITYFTPTSGYTGTTVWIYGKHFTGATAVSFGGVRVDSIYIASDTAIRTNVGPGASGNVTVTTPHGTASLGGFTYRVSPTLISFTPTSAARGTNVTLFGTHLSGVTTVKFGGVAADSFLIVSDSIIEAKVGAGATGYVLVQSPDGISTAQGFTYINTDSTPPYISTFIPSSARKGETVNIYGNHFTGTTSVSFGGVAASSYSYISDTVITAVVGAGATGDIVVTTPYGIARKPGFIFIIDSIPGDTTVPSIAFFTPGSGRTGDSILISGSHFTGTTAVTFGDTTAYSFFVLNDSTIVAVVGAGASGNVAVVKPYGTATKSGFTFIRDSSSLLTRAATASAANANSPVNSSFMVYPNPASAYTIAITPATNHQAQLQLIDIMGRIVRTVKLASKVQQAKVDLNGVMKGVYKLVWSDGSKIITRTIFVK